MWSEARCDLTGGRETGLIWEQREGTVRTGQECHQARSALDRYQVILGTNQGVLIRGVASFLGWVCTIQWTPSNPATLRTSQSVLIRAMFQRQD